MSSYFGYWAWVRKSKPLHERVWRELGPKLQLKTPARWKAINQGLGYSTNTPYIMVERLVSKAKHLAPAL